MIVEHNTDAVQIAEAVINTLGVLITIILILLIEKETKKNE